MVLPRSPCIVTVRDGHTGPREFVEGSFCVFDVLILSTRPTKLCVPTNFVFQKL
jgi:hypothetical protein